MGTRLGGVWGELVGHVYGKYSSWVLHLARVFSLVFGAMPKSNPSGAFNFFLNNYYYLSPRRLGVSFLLPGQKRNQKTPRRLWASYLLGFDIPWISRLLSAITIDFFMILHLWYYTIVQIKKRISFLSFLYFFPKLGIDTSFSDFLSIFVAKHLSRPQWVIVI